MVGYLAPWRSHRPSQGSRRGALLTLTDLRSGVRMQHGPLLGCHHRIAERKDRAGHLLTELVTLAKNRDHVTRRGKLQREADCRAPITAIDYLGLQLRSPYGSLGPTDELSPDRAWIFGAGIVISCDHYVGVLSCRLPHRLPFLRISVSAATEHDDATTGTSRDAKRL